MICDNCGAEIDKKERYCPNCGMELPGPAPKPSKKKYYKNSRASTPDDSHSQKNYRNYYDEEEGYKRKPSKRSHQEDPADFTYDIPHPHTDYRNYDEEEDYERKPLKRKYYERPSASAHHDSQYQDELGYESYYTNEEEYETQKSGTSLGTILFVLIIILLLGFIIGLIMFSSNQIIPQVPGINS